tara:strand:- start:538 stop:918 length:381 start_codon:yes stop_codon:yes gene_type:complete
MAYPTGTGSECLFRGTINSQSTDITAFRWDRTDPTLGTDTYTVPALHIITLLSVIICDQGNASSVVQMYMNNGSSDIWLLEDLALGMDETFIWSDRIVLVGGDKMLIESNGTADITYSFIDQNWED